MAAIAVWALLCLVVLAAAETNLLLLVGILIVPLEDKLKGFVSASFLVVGTIAEWLVL